MDVREEGECQWFFYTKYIPVLDRQYVFQNNCMPHRTQNTNTMNYLLLDFSVLIVRQKNSPIPIFSKQYIMRSYTHFRTHSTFTYPEG